MLPPSPPTGYESLSPSDDTLAYSKELGESARVDTSFLQRRLRVHRLLLSLSVAVNVIFILSVLFGDYLTSFHLLSTEEWVRWRGAKPVYSPAAEAISHQRKLMSTFTHVDGYYGNRSHQQDRLWSNEYLPHTWLGISRELAGPLYNHTERVPNDVEDYGEPRYIIDLDIFHQLHCLDMIRKRLRPAPWDHHPPPKFPPVSAPGEPPYDHVDHCLNSIRQTLKCNPDITPVVFQWNPDIQQNRARIDVLHTCVNWDALTSWADKWKMHSTLDMVTHVGDDWDRRLPTP